MISELDKTAPLLADECRQDSALLDMVIDDYLLMLFLHYTGEQGGDTREQACQHIEERLAALKCVLAQKQQHCAGVIAQ